MCVIRCNLGPDYMVNFSPASEANPLKIKLSLTWRGIQPKHNSAGVQFSSGCNSARAENRSLVFANRARIFSPAKLARKSEVSCNQNGISAGLKSRKQYGCRWEAEAISIELR